MRYVSAALIAVIFGFVTYLMGSFTMEILEQLMLDTSNLGLFVGFVMMGCVTTCLAGATVCVVGVEINSEF